MKKLLILSSFITILSAGFVNLETGWEYQQSTFQGFYMLETTEIDGATIEAADVIGAFKNGISKDIAAGIFLKIEPFAEYGFNKSHAAAYGIIAYQTAFLKTYHPKEFFAASMSMELGNQSKLSEFYEELKRLNIKIERPNINKCFAEFKTTEETDLEIEKTYTMGVYICLGQNIHNVDIENAIPFESLKSFKAIHELLEENEKVLVFLTKAEHKIKKKAEQLACENAIKLIT